MASLATLAAVGLEAVYERWLWAAVPARFNRRPDLEGTWRGTFSSHWVDPETNTIPQPTDCYLVIHQTASSIRATFLTNESRSDSSVAEIVTNGSGSLLRYLYGNEPQIKFDQRSAGHLGAVSLHINSGTNKLEGHYWTDRHSRGELALTHRIEQRCATFEEANSLEW